MFWSLLISLSLSLSLSSTLFHSTIWVLPSHQRIGAYSDRPFKQGYVHISAPHMYATVLEHLELQPGHSFLNIGSGSGYFSCLAACLLGEGGLSHGIDINPTVVAHSKECCERWFNSILSRRAAGEAGLPTISREGVALVHGNCFDIDVSTAVSSCRYDRIYIGAGCPEDKKEFFFSLLSDSGIMVAPIDDSDCLVKIRRQCRNVYSVTHISRVHFTPLLQPPPIPRATPLSTAATTTTVIPTGRLSHFLSAALASDVTSRFPLQAPLQGTTPGASTATATAVGLPLVRLPPLVWAPVASRHKQFPPRFRDAVFVLLQASHHCAAEVRSGDSSSSGGGGSAPGSSRSRIVTRGFPLHIWTYILSFASRDWFETAKTEAQLLAEELQCERRLRTVAEQQLRVALAARGAAERERDELQRLLEGGGRRALETHAAPGGGEGEEDVGGEGEEEEEEEEEEDEEEEEEEDAVDMYEALDFHMNEGEEEVEEEEEEWEQEEQDEWEEEEEEDDDDDDEEEVNDEMGEGLYDVRMHDTDAVSAPTAPTAAPVA